MGITFAMKHPHDKLEGDVSAVPVQSPLEGRRRFFLIAHPFPVESKQEFYQFYFNDVNRIDRGFLFDIQNAIAYF
jgi:hypothetical protein